MIDIRAIVSLDEQGPVYVGGVVCRYTSGGSMTVHDLVRALDAALHQRDALDECIATMQRLLDEAAGARVADADPPACAECEAHPADP